MEASPSPSVAPVDPYVLEFAVNLKWLLRYATQQLGPTVEQHFPAFVAEVASLDAVLDHLSFDKGCTLNEMPFGTLRLSRECVLYLLVCDHLLGGCPPTMHPFLRRACRAQAQHVAPHATARGNEAAPRRTQGHTLHADLNESFPSDGDNSDLEAVREHDAFIHSRVTELDAKPLAALGSGHSMDVVRDTLADHSDTAWAAQAALILVRWMFVEGVLSEDELAATLDIDTASEPGSSASGDGGVPRSKEEVRVFRRHQRLAARLAEVVPFYMGAHVLISRSLLLQYCASLLTVDGVMRHVRCLEAPLQSASHRSLAEPSLVPPTSVEGALLEWFQAIMDSTRQQVKERAVATAQIRSCTPLEAFVCHGPFCHHVLDPAERDFFRLVQSGECVLLALWFYIPDALPLAQLTRALREAEEYMSVQHPERPHPSSLEERVTALQRHQSVCYWTAALAAARTLGMTPVLTAEDVVAFGSTALPLHLFVFVQQLFAVLATNAEEDVRVSADTAWWEHAGYTAGSAAAADVGEQSGSPQPHTTAEVPDCSSDAAVCAAQDLLRRSMRDSFPPDMIRQAMQRDETKSNEDECVMQQDEGHSPSVDGLVAEIGRASTSATRNETHATNGTSRCGVAVMSLGSVAKATASDVQGDAARPAATAEALKAIRRLPPSAEAEETFEAHVVKAALHSAQLHTRHASGSRDDDTDRTASVATTSAATSTQFTVEFAHTQRGGVQASQSPTDAMESVAAALRPMARRRTSAAPANTYSVETFTSLTTLERAATEEYASLNGASADRAEKVVFAVQVVDTYSRTPDDYAALAPAATRGDDVPCRGLGDSGLRKGASSRSSQHPSPEREEQLGRQNGHSILSNSQRDTTADSRYEQLPSQRQPGSDAKNNYKADTFTIAKASPTAESLPSSPKLPPSHVSMSPKPRELATAQPVAHLDVAVASSASSLTYSADFVVQSVPHNEPANSPGDAAVPVEDSASLHDAADVIAADAPLTEATKEEMPSSSGSSSSSPSSPSQLHPMQADAIVSASGTAIKKFTTADSDGSSADSKAGTRSSGHVNGSDDDEKERSMHLPQVVGVASKSSLSTPSSLSSSASSPRVARKQPVPSTRDTPAQEEAAVQQSPVSPSVTDIAVEDDGTISALWHDADLSRVGESFPTPTEREEANRRRALAASALQDSFSESAASPLQPTGTPLPHQQLDEARRLPDVLSPLPARPQTRAPPVLTYTADRVSGDSGGPARPGSPSLTLSEGSQRDGLSPLTPALTQSISEVFGSEYVSLLEDAANSSGGLPHHRRSLPWDEESWFSSASHPHRQSLHSSAGSALSAAQSAVDSTQVRGLLQRLLATATLDDWEGKDKEELREALAQQQQLVQQLTAALQTRRSRVGVRGFRARPRSTERTRQVRLRSPSEERSTNAGDGGLSRRSEGRSVLLTEATGFSASRAGSRLGSASGMTVESRGSPQYSMQSDGGGQLAETDVSTLLADILLPAQSPSPTRSRRR